MRGLLQHEQLIGLELLENDLEMAADLGTLHNRLVRLDLLVVGHLKDFALDRDAHVVRLYVNVDKGRVQMPVYGRNGKCIWTESQQCVRWCGTTYLYTSNNRL